MSGTNDKSLFDFTARADNQVQEGETNAMELANLERAEISNFTRHEQSH